MTEVYTENAAGAAANYRDRGWATIPLKIRSKEPKLPKGHPFLKRKASDEEFARFDFRHNVGIVCGKVSKVIVLDDDDNGETLRKHGWHVPPTPTVRTQRGNQYYFRCPEDEFSTFGVTEKLEVRGDGAYVVAPPSVHPSGHVYEWVISPDEAELADPPDWLLEQARLRSRRMRAEDVGEEIRDGSRNKTLFSLAGTLRRRGLDEAAIYAALLGVNSTKCKPLLSEAEVEKIARSASRYEPATETPNEPGGSRSRSQENGHQTDPQHHTDHGEFRRTDLGNAERLVARYGDDLRYCHPWRKWLAWDGRRWKSDASGEVERRAVETVRAIYAEAERADDADERKRIARHASASESRARIEAMIALARSLPGIPVEPDQLDADPWALNAENGTVDLRTGDLREHSRGDLITKLTPVEYDPDAAAPTFERFLERILPSEALRRFVQRATGYAASGVVSEEVLMIFHGTGDNGKTTLVNAALDALGDYAIQAARDLLLAKRGSHPTELTDLFGARFVACSETDDGRRLAEALVKQLTGRARIRARGMREDFWEFNPTHTIFLDTNHRPEIKGTDHAIWRRIKLVPFDVKIPEKEKNNKLPEELRAELPGILAWIVRGCLEYLRDGLGEPEKVTTATASYRADMDTLAAFIEERCVVGEGLWVKFAHLWRAYTDWCKESNEDAGTKRGFADLLTERGFEKDNGAKNVAVRKGIALRDDGDPDPSRVNDDPPETDPDPPSDPPDREENVNRVNNREENVTSQNSCKSQGSGERVNEGYRVLTMNGLKTPRGRLYTKVVNPSLTVNPDGDPDSSSLNPPNPPKPSALTPAQVAEYKRLVAEGMSPEWARAEVRGEGVDLS